MVEGGGIRLIFEEGIIRIRGFYKFEFGEERMEREVYFYFIVLVIFLLLYYRVV